MTEDLLVIAAAGRVIDGDGSLSSIAEARQRLRDNGARIVEYQVAPLSFGWNAPLPDGYLKGACSPIEGCILARRLIREGSADAVMISGSDHIKSDFALHPQEREHLMRVYGKRTFLSAYDELAGVFCERISMTKADFDDLARCLFENYWMTWSLLNPNASRPDDRWFAKVASHFRGVDCANPNIDFDGAVIVTTTATATVAGLEQFLAIRGASVVKGCEDGVENIPEIANYNHLREAYEVACEEAGLDVGPMLLEGRARLETYSCFPVVPIAFLLRTGLAHDGEEIRKILEHHPITITGGLNLARAPWNNTTLSALFQATRTIKETPVIGIHSIAALGYKQAFAVLAEPGFSP